MTTKLEIAKTAVNVVVGAGTSKIVHTIIKNNVQPEKLTDTVSVAAGSLVLGSMVAEASKKYTSDKIDKLAAWYKANVTDAKK